MQTKILIDALTDDFSAKPLRRPISWGLLAAVSAALVAVEFFASVGVRPDFAAAIETVRFVFKFVLTFSLSVAAYIAMQRLAYPGVEPFRATTGLLIPTVLLLAAVVIELAVVPERFWAERAIGSNSIMCMTIIPAMGTPLLLMFLAVLRRQAPTMPTLSGAMAGLAAASFSAFFYAAQCTDDSPLFVAVWYPLASLVLISAGGALGSKLLKW